MQYLGDYQIDSYITFGAQLHRFSSGAVYAPTGNVTYTFYENNSTTGAPTGGNLSQLNSKTGLYTARVQLTTAAGFEVGKEYLIHIEATVDSVAAAELLMFRTVAADVPQSGDVYAIVSGGRIAADMQAISGDATAADNLETMLDGTGGQTLSLGALNVVANASTPAVTISNAGTGNAVKLQSQSGHTLYLKQVADANNSGIQIESAGTGMWIVASNDNGIEITTDGANAIGLMINSYKQALVLASEIGETIRISTNVNNKPAVYVRHYGANPGPAVKLESTVSAGLEVLGTTPAPDILLSGTGNLTAILSGLGANAITAAAIADDAGTEIAGAVRTELAVELAHLDADVSDAGGGLTAQETRDAMKLAPTAGSPAAGSVDADLDTIVSDVAAVKAITDTLDRSALTVVTVNDVGAITIKRTLTLAAVVSGLTIPADWTACFWTVKRSVDDTDADALIQIVVSNPPDAEDGLLTLAGAAAEDGSAGSLTVNQALGTVTIALDDASTAELEDAVELVWDVKVHAPGAKTQPGAGTATITTAVTRA